MSLPELKNLIQQSGIVGAGGAGFPSYGKLADGADTLVINGAEFEPLLYTDYVLLHNEMPMVLAGISAVLEYQNIPRALLCVKEHTAERLHLQDNARLADKIYVKVLPNVYPMGDEISLIYQATGRVVKAGNLPITAGVIVYNVETMYNVAAAVKYSAPVTMKWLTVAGILKILSLSAYPSVRPRARFSKSLTLPFPKTTRLSTADRLWGNS